MPVPDHDAADLDHPMENVVASSLQCRNRRNALKSTGPRTAEGKSIARRNALKHGLAANPAAGVIEDPALNVVEDRLTFRLAHLLWRQHRAVLIDGALSRALVRQADDDQAAVQGWLNRLQGFWRVERVLVTDPEELVRLNAPLDLPVYRSRRTILHSLDQALVEEFMPVGAGLTAMAAMLEALMDKLRSKWGIDPEEAEQLAWLLGEPARRYPLDLTEVRFPDEGPCPFPADKLIGEARRRPIGASMPEGIESAARSRLAVLLRQREQARVPFTHDGRMDALGSALLYDPQRMEQLLHYEAQTDRGIGRCLKTLAEARGVTFAELLGHRHEPCIQPSHDVQGVLPFAEPLRLTGAFPQNEAKVAKRA